MKRDVLKIIEARASKNPQMQELIALCDEPLDSHISTLIESSDIKQSDKKLLLKNWDRLFQKLRMERLLEKLHGDIQNMKNPEYSRPKQHLYIYNGTSTYHYNGFEVTPGTVVTICDEYTRLDHLRTKVSRSELEALKPYLQSVGEMTLEEANFWISNHIAKKHGQL